MKYLYKPTLFGFTPSGEKVIKYKITNSNGLTAEIINFGAIVQTLKIPDRNGIIEDIILGFDDLGSYFNDTTYQGAIVGPYANRITNGQFNLNGKNHQLEINEGKNHLHGGSKGFSKDLWQGKMLQNNSVQFSLLYPDGQDGYPGDIRLEVRYSLNDQNEFIINYSGNTDKPTILNPTSHCYFNLTGDFEQSILNHELEINADYYTPINKYLIPCGEITSVENTPFDFRLSKKIGKDIQSKAEQLQIGNGYDHNWAIKEFNGAIRFAAKLFDHESGRILELKTDQPGMQFYSGNFLRGIKRGKDGIIYKNRAALCLEAQVFPDSPNRPNFPWTHLQPGDQYKQTTIYKFSNILD